MLNATFWSVFSNIVILLTMHVHVATAGKSLFTDLTLIRLFSSMSISVFLKGQLGGKTFATYFALKRFCMILCMKYGHMGLHSGLGDKFSTRSARWLFMYRSNMLKTSIFLRFTSVILWFTSVILRFASVLWELQV